MTIDLDRYIVNKDFIQQYYCEHKEENIVRMISKLSNITLCPCIVVAYWVGDASNWPQEVIDCIKRLKVFYRYDEVLNKPKGSPE